MTLTCIMLSVLFLFDVGHFDAMELPIQLGFIVDHILNVSIEFLRGIFELVSPSTLQDVPNLHLVPLCHRLGARSVLGHHKVLDSEHDDEKEEKQFRLVLGEDLPRIDKVS